MKTLLRLENIIRDPGLTDSEHAHCLFKLALYHEELAGRLEGLVVEPSTSFGYYN